MKSPRSPRLSFGFIRRAMWESTFTAVFSLATSWRPLYIRDASRMLLGPYRAPGLGNRMPMSMGAPATTAIPSLTSSNPICGAL